MQELLDVVAAWGHRRNIKFSPKSFAATLSEQGSTEEEKPPLHVGDVPVSWHPSDAPFRYLGVTTHTSKSPSTNQWRGGAAPVPLKEGKVQAALGGLYSMFRIKRHQYYVVPTALRTAIEQVVYAGALYDAAIMDTDYEKLDSLTLAAVRHILQIPPRTPTAFLRWELRLPPSRLRAHKRALRWAHQLWHGSWIGQEILKPYLLDNTSRQQAEEIHPIFEMGPVGRLTRILQEYGLTWAAISVKNKDEKSKDETKDEKREKRTDAPQRPKGEKAQSVTHDCTCAALLPWIRQKLEDSVGIPATHKKELAIHMGIDEGDYSWAGQLNPQDLPLYLFIDGDLPRAGLWARMPYLRAQPRGDKYPRAPCAWCKGPEKEYGYHLMRCPRMPPRLRRRRDAVLTTITEEVAAAAPKDWKGDAPQPDDPLSPINLNRLFYLHWEGKKNWIHSKKHPRSDRKKQPSKEVLTAALWYLRDMINTYRLSTKKDNGANPVWELPVYNRETDLYADPGPWAAADNKPLPPPPLPPTQIGDSLANLAPPPEEE
jgi:hypothetical protein